MADSPARSWLWTCQIYWHKQSSGAVGSPCQQVKVSSELESEPGIISGSSGTASNHCSRIRFQTSSHSRWPVTGVLGRHECIAGGEKGKASSQSMLISFCFLYLLHKHWPITEDKMWTPKSVSCPQLIKWYMITKIAPRLMKTDIFIIPQLISAFLCAPILHFKLLYLNFRFFPFLVL